MTSKAFDPEKFIDREFEQELFEDLLAFKDDARILAIRDAGGMGKSQLLERFQYRCRTVRPRTPVSLIALDQLADSTPLMLVRKIREHLSAYGIGFPNFTRYDTARMSADFDFISDSFYLEGSRDDAEPGDAFSHYERGLVQLISRVGSDHANYTDIMVYQQRLSENISRSRRHGNTDGYRAERAEIIEQLNIVARSVLRVTFNDLCGTESGGFRSFERSRGLRTPEYNKRGELTPEQDLAAQEVSIRAMFDDLHACCARQPVVLLFDAYEKCSDVLKTWLVEQFLERQFFDLDDRPAWLLLVVAGRDLPAFSHYWSVDDCRAVVRSVSELGKWTRAHVEECLRVHGFDYEPPDVDAFHRLIERGIPPSQVVQMVEALAAGRRRT